MKNEGNLNAKNTKEDLEHKIDDIENRSYSNIRLKHKCFQCNKFEVKSRIYKCFSCGNFKCFDCASHDTIKNKLNVKGDSYICNNCLNVGSKNRKKTNESLSNSGNNIVHGNANELKNKNSNNNDGNNESVNLLNELIKNVNSTVEKEKLNNSSNKLLGKKRKKDLEIFDMSFIEKEAENVTRILDIDKLHSAVEPPYEIFHEGSKQDTLGKKPYNVDNLTRKSIRQKKPTANNQMMFSIINCHQCRRIDVTTNVLTCSNENCRESFCIICTKKYSKGSSISKFIKLKSSEENKSWICFKCKKMCMCKSCKGERQNTNFHNIQTISTPMAKDISNTERKLINNSKIKGNIVTNSKSKSITTKKKLKSKRKNRIINNISFNGNFSIKRNNHNNMIITIPNLNLCFNNNENEQENESQENYDKFEIDNYVVYEIKEKLEINQNSYESIFKKEEKLILEDNKLYSYLIRIADEVEKFYFSYINSDIDISEKICFLCKNSSYPVDSLLQFKSFEQFLGYLKFVFIFRRKLMTINEKKYTKNLTEIFDFIDMYNDNIRKKIYFTTPKFSCKFCILSYINKNNALFRILKIIRNSIKHIQKDSDFNVKEKVEDIVQNFANKDEKDKSNTKHPDNSKKSILDLNYLISNKKSNISSNNQSSNTIEKSNIITTLNLNNNKMNSNSFPGNIQNNLNSLTTNSINMTNTTANLNSKMKSFSGNIKKTTHNLPNDLVNFNDKPDLNQNRIKEKPSVGIPQQKRVSITPSGNIINNTITNINNVKNFNFLTNDPDKSQPSSQINNNFFMGNKIFDTISDISHNNNSTPVKNSLNLEVIFTKISSLKKHFDNSSNAYANSNDMENCKKFILETNNLINDLLKSLKEFSDQIRQYSYYLSLIFSKTDKLKESINEIFPHLEKIISQVYNALDEGNEKVINSLCVTLGHVISINDLLGLCKYELNDVNLIKNYSSNNILSDDILKMFTVFVNLGKNPTFINSLMNIFKNITQTAFIAEMNDNRVKDFEMKNIQDSQKSLLKNYSEDKNSDNIELEKEFTFTSKNINDIIRNNKTIELKKYKSPEGDENDFEKHSQKKENLIDIEISPNSTNINVENPYTNLLNAFGVNNYVNKINNKSQNIENKSENKLISSKNNFQSSIFNNSTTNETKKNSDVSKIIEFIIRNNQENPIINDKNKIKDQNYRSLDSDQASLTEQKQRSTFEEASHIKEYNKINENFIDKKEKKIEEEMQNQTNSNINNLSFYNKTLNLQKNNETEFKINKHYLQYDVNNDNDSPSVAKKQDGNKEENNRSDQITKNKSIPFSFDDILKLDIYKSNISNYDETQNKIANEFLDIPFNKSEIKKSEIHQSNIYKKFEDEIIREDILNRDKKGEIKNILSDIKDEIDSKRKEEVITKNNQIIESNQNSNNFIFKSSKPENLLITQQNFKKDGNKFMVVNNVIDNYANKASNILTNNPNNLFICNNKISNEIEKITPNFFNNQLTVDDRKKVYFYNDPDDSGNIQEHFNVNVQHDNIINDEPVKNTIFTPGFENLNENSIPKFIKKTI